MSAAGNRSRSAPPSRPRAAGTHEVGAVAQRSTGRFDHRGVAMAEGHRPEPGAVLDELVAVDVPHAGAQPSLDESRRVLGVLVVALGVRVSASWDELVGSLAELDRPSEARSVSRLGDDSPVVERLGVGAPSRRLRYLVAAATQRNASSLNQRLSRWCAEAIYQQPHLAIDRSGVESARRRSRAEGAIRSFRSSEDECHRSRQPGVSRCCPRAQRISCSPHCRLPRPRRQHH